MGTTNGTCRWARRRLPLLVGGDLTGTERRRVERHLIGCPACRDRRAAAVRSHDVLRDFAALGPITLPGQPEGDAPSLWPALARQIRESKHQRPVAPFGEWVGSWVGRPVVGWVGSGVAAAGLLLALGSVWTGARTNSPTPTAVTAPAAVAVVSPAPLGGADPAAAPLLADNDQIRRLFDDYDQLIRRFRQRRSALPAASAGDDIAAAKPGVDPFAPPLDLRLNYDLEIGRLVGPAADTQRAY